MKRFDELFEELSAKVAAGEPGSGTVDAVANGPHFIGKKLVEACISEAITNMLLHGGGHGAMTVRRLGDRLRFVVADRGPGLNFLNWIEPPAEGGQASMGYGYKIILDHLDSVALHTGSGGTTLVLDRLTS